MREFFPSRTSRKRARRNIKIATTMASALGIAFGLPKVKTKAKGRPASATKKTAPRKASAAAKTSATAKALTKASASPRAIGKARPASFRTASHACEHGQRRYKIFVPSGASSASKPLPLLIMMHGCGQTPDDFAKGTRMNALAEEFGLIVVYPAQPSYAHPNRCWNWFNPGDQGRDDGEPALITSLTRHILDTQPTDRSRVYVAGLSAGASAALVLAHAYPDLFAAVGVHSGIPLGGAKDKATAVAAMQRGNPGARLTMAIPTITFHGSADRVVNPRNGRLVTIRAVEPFKPLAPLVTYGGRADSHAYVRTRHRVGAGRPWVEQWVVKGLGHAWSGGSKAGFFTDPAGPDASREMIRFFLRHKRPARRTAPG